MSKEIRDLLESALKEHNDDCLLCALKDTRINSALTLLKQQPIAGEFTNQIRQLAKLNFESHNYGEKIIAHIDRSLIYDLCDLLDTSEAENKDLLEALEENYEFTKYAGAVKKTNTDEYLEEFFAKGESAQKVALAAIAKVQKEG